MRDMPSTMRRILGVLLALFAGAAAAQSYPSKPIRIVVPFTQGRCTGSRRRGCCWGGDGARPPGLRHGVLRWLIIAMLAGASLLVPPVVAQTYPSKPIRLIVPFAPGGGSDVIARIIGQKLAETLGQQVIVDNRPGAGATIGTEFGVRAEPDGYTLTLITPSYAISPGLYPIKFDPLNDFTPVIHIAKGPLVVVVHPSLPAKSMRELIALIRAKPGQLAFGTAGQGTIIHLATELFLDRAGLEMTHVPYKGGGPALTDLIAGQIPVVFATPQTGLPQAKAGRVRALAVTSAERIAVEPDIPTIAESGVSGYEAINWHGLIGPKGLPRPIVDRINREAAKVIRMKEVEERLQADGVAPTGGTPEQFYALVRKEIAQWREVIAHAKVRIE